MDIKQFTKFVKLMRQAQQEYFKTRDRRILMRSINLEKIVDDMVSDYYNPGKNLPTQMDLFPEER